MKNIFRKIAYAGAATLLIGGAAFACAPNNNDHNDHKKDMPELTSESTIKADVDNNAHVNNDVLLDANTGENEAERNHGDGEVDTGNANLSGSVSNKLNTADITVKAPSACSDCVEEFQGDVKLESTIKLDVDNNACVKNDVVLDANTGENEAEHNGGDGSVTTGSATLSASVSNELNYAKIVIN